MNLYLSDKLNMLYEEKRRNRHLFVTGKISSSEFIKASTMLEEKINDVYDKYTEGFNRWQTERYKKK